MAEKDELGRAGENIAARYLQDAGYRILERNWRGERGELDIIATEGREVVFVEVKTRSSHDYGHPFEAVTAKKLARLKRLALQWCLHAEVRACAIRIDVVAVTGSLGAPARIEHLKQVA